MEQLKKIKVKSCKLPYVKDLLGYDSIRWDHYIYLIRDDLIKNIDTLIKYKHLDVYYNSDTKMVVLVPCNNRLAYIDKIKKDFVLILTMEKIKESPDEIEYTFRIVKEDLFKSTNNLKFYHNFILYLEYEKEDCCSEEDKIYYQSVIEELNDLVNQYKSMSSKLNIDKDDEDKDASDYDLEIAITEIVDEIRESINENIDIIRKCGGLPEHIESFLEG